MGWRDEEQRLVSLGWAAMGFGGLLFWGGLAWSLALGRAFSRNGTMRRGQRAPLLRQHQPELGLPERAALRAPEHTP